MPAAAPQAPRAKRASAPLVEFDEVEPDVLAVEVLAAALTADVVMADEAVEEALVAAVDEAEAAVELAEPSLPSAAARTVELKVPVTLLSSKRAEKAISSAVPLAAAFLDSKRMK